MIWIVPHLTEILLVFREKFFFLIFFYPSLLYLFDTHKKHRLWQDRSLSKTLRSKIRENLISLSNCLATSLPLSCPFHSSSSPSSSSSSSSSPTPTTQFPFWCPCLSIHILASGVSQAQDFLPPSANKSLKFVQDHCPFSKSEMTRSVRPLHQPAEEKKSSSVSWADFNITGLSFFFFDEIRVYFPSLISNIVFYFLDGKKLFLQSKTISCSRCGCSRRLYCPSCVLQLPPTQNSLSNPEEKEEIDDPRADIQQSLASALPPNLILHFIFHPKVSLSNSTSLHAALLLPSDRTKIYKLPEKLPFFDPTDSVVLFPSNESVLLRFLFFYSLVSKKREILTQITCVFCSEMGAGNVSKIKNIIMIESTWQSAQEIINHPSIRSLPQIRLILEQPPRQEGAIEETKPQEQENKKKKLKKEENKIQKRGEKGLYWRSPGNTLEGNGCPYLSTIEAIRLTLNEVVQIGDWGDSSSSSSFSSPPFNMSSDAFDDLLFYLKIESERRSDSIQCRMSHS